MYTKNNNLKIMVIAAHPDDEVLGCGGTIARYVAEGSQAFCLILGEGITSRNIGQKDSKTELKKLKAEARRATGIIGVKKLFLRDFPDNRFDTVPLLTIVQSVEEIIKGIAPDIVFTHHQGDLNIDHQVTFRAVMTACRPSGDNSVKEIYSFEVPSSTEWNAPNSQSYFMPNVFVDISATLDKKIAALKAYTGEIRSNPHPRSPEVLRAIAVRWGSTAGCEAAEAFELIRAIR